jgi:hypothetical protein
MMDEVDDLLDSLAFQDKIIPQLKQSDRFYIVIRCPDGGYKSMFSGLNMELLGAVQVCMHEDMHLIWLKLEESNEEED